MSFTDRINRLPELQSNYEAALLEILWAALFLYIVLPADNPLRYPILFTGALIWSRECFCNDNLMRRASKSAVKTILLFLAWASFAVVISYLTERFISGQIAFLFDEITQTLQTKLARLIELQLLNFLIFTILSAVAFGLLFAVTANGRQTVFSYLRPLSLPLLIISVDLLINNVTHYDEENMPIIVMQVILLTVNLLLTGYNRIKFTASGRDSKAYYALLATELMINVNNTALPLVLKH